MEFNKQLFAVCLGVAVSTVALADAAASDQASQPSRYYAGVSFAGSFNIIKNTIYIAPPVPNPDQLDTMEYQTNKGGNFTPDFGLQFGRNIVMNGKWSTHLGLGFYANKDLTYRGLHYQIAMPPADQDYRYDVSIMRLMVEANMFYHHSDKVAYFYGVGVGMAHIRTSNLTFTDIAPSTANDPKSEVLTQNHIVGSADVGVDFALNTHWHLAGSLQQLWLGDNMIDIEDANGNVTPHADGQLHPWQIKATLSYNF